MVEVVRGAVPEEVTPVPEGPVPVGSTPVPDDVMPVPAPVPSGEAEVKVMTVVEVVSLKDMVTVRVVSKVVVAELVVPFDGDG
jgi:hypothetical protein